MTTTVEQVELAWQEARKTRTMEDIDALARLARVLSRALTAANTELTERRAADLTLEEALALRGCSVHCTDEDQLRLATSAIDKTVARALRCPRCGDSGVLKYATSGGESYAALFCDCPAGEARR